MIHSQSPTDKRHARSITSKNKIAEAAEHIILTHGRSALTTSALVEAAGVSERTIFNHFKKLDTVISYRAAHYLDALITTEPFPQGLPTAHIPQAILDHFHRSIDNPGVQERLYGFTVLAAALSEEEISGFAQEILTTLSGVCDDFCAHIKASYPELTLDQLLANHLFTFNLLAALMLAFPAAGASLRARNPDLPEDYRFTSIEPLLPFIRKNLNQVAQGTPVYSTHSL